MTNLSTLSLEDLKKLEAEVAAKRDAYIHAELGKDLTPYNRANSTTPLDNHIYEIVSEISRRERPAKEAAEQAAFAAEWTLEAFTARRAAWNTEVTKLPRTAKGLKFEDVRALEARLGYTMDDLKRAKALLGIA
ncbi:hypothetical protein ATER59S_02356 [Aquamicrobium terrae]